MTKNLKKKIEGLLFIASGKPGKIKVAAEVGGVTLFYLFRGDIIAMGTGASLLEALKDTIRNARFLYKK